MNFRLSGPRALFLSACAAGLSGLLSACGQSPGETGLGYLESQGVQLSAPLYRLSLEDLPLDSVFAVETPVNHFGESLLVVGRDDRYTARARLGFQITTSRQRDSLTSGLHLRLGALPSSVPFAGLEWLRESSRDHDSLRLLVESVSWPEGGSGSYGDTLNLFHRLLLTAPVPMSTLDPRFRRLDTIVVHPSQAYPDSNAQLSQAGPLPNLWHRLRNDHGGDSTKRWLVFVEISPLAPSDSGWFPFISQAAGNSATLRLYNSGLWLGRHVADSLPRVGTLVAPYRTGLMQVPAANYEVKHTGSSTRSLLYGVARGLHLRVNRDTLLQRIRTALNAREATLGDRLLGSAPAGERFDRRFFVPYARLRLPVDTALTSVQGPFALDMTLSSDVDSLDSETESFRDDIDVAVGAQIGLPMRGGGSGSVPDTLVVAYRAHPADTALRQILYHWASRPTAADTVIVEPNGLRRELAARRQTAWPRATTLTVHPEAARLRVEVYFSVASVTEPNAIYDSTGRQVTSFAGQSARYLRPGADSLAVRATHGIRNVLNRVHEPGVGSVPDMLLQGARRAAFDTSTTESGSTYRRVPYPVFGEVDFKRDGDGKLRVGLDLYLYPLEARP